MGQIEIAASVEGLADTVEEPPSALLGTERLVVGMLKEADRIPVSSVRRSLSSTPFTPSAVKS